MKSIATLDRTSLATSGQQLLEFSKKTAQNATASGFELNFSGVAFCLYQLIGGLLVFNISETTRASSVYHNVALDSLYISTGNVHFGSCSGRNFSTTVQPISKC